MNMQESGIQTPAISLEQLSAIIAAIHAAAAFPERGRDAVSAVTGLMNSLPQRWQDAVSAVAGVMSSSDSAEPVPARDREKASGPGELSSQAVPMCNGGDPSVQHVLGLLSPHFEAAREIRMMLAEASRGRLAQACLDRFAMAALVVDGAGEVLHLNASARSLLVGNRLHVRSGSRGFASSSPDCMRNSKPHFAGLRKPFPAPRLCLSCPAVKSSTRSLCRRSNRP